MEHCCSLFYLIYKMENRTSTQMSHLKWLARKWRTTWVRLKLCPQSWPKWMQPSTQRIGFWESLIWLSTLSVSFMRMQRYLGQKQLLNRVRVRYPALLHPEFCPTTAVETVLCLCIVMLLIKGTWHCRPFGLCWFRCKAKSLGVVKSQQIHTPLAVQCRLRVLIQGHS